MARVREVTNLLQKQFVDKNEVLQGGLGVGCWCGLSAWVVGVGVGQGWWWCWCGLWMLID